MSVYSDLAAFRGMLQSGRRPDGSTVNSAMPFNALKRLDDVDTEALYAYLRSLPARPLGQR